MTCRSAEVDDKGRFTTVFRFFRGPARSPTGGALFQSSPWHFVRRCLHSNPCGIQKEPQEPYRTTMDTKDSLRWEKARARHRAEKRPRVVVLSKMISDEDAVVKCAELIEFANENGGVDEPTMRKLETAKKDALAGRLLRVQAHLLTTVEKAVKTSMRWRLTKLRDVAGEEATSPEIGGEGIRINGVEWKNPVAFKRKYEFRCPMMKVVGGRLNMEQCSRYDCTCKEMMRAQTYLGKIEETIELEAEDDRGRERVDEVDRVFSQV